jgi:TPR repeat protein
MGKIPMVSLFEQASLAWDQGDDKKAFELFHQAAEQGDENSLLNLGYCYDEGVGTTKDKMKAMYWYKKAAQNGDLSAYTNIAIYYASIGDFTQAKRWYFDALKKGDKDVALGLAKLGLDGNINLSHAEIFEYLQIIIDAKRMVEVSEASQEEARLLLEQL